MDETGENVIIVVSGANMELTTDELEQASAAISEASCVVCQMEVPLAVTQKAMEMARAAGVKTVFNVAPCPVDGQLPAEIYAVTDVLCVNETELQTLAGVTAAEGDLEGYKTAAQALLARGVGCVLVTLGGDGCIVCTGSDEGATHVPAVPLPKEAVVDTTGAGDAYTGAFAVFMGMGLSIPEAAGRAGQVASLTVQTEGTQPSCKLVVLSRFVALLVSLTHKVSLFQTRSETWCVTPLPVSAFANACVRRAAERWWCEQVLGKLPEIFS